MSTNAGGIIHELQLDDAACPSFCSFTKGFYGTYRDIKAFMNALAEHNEKGHHDMILKAFQAWETGDHEVEHSPAYHTCKLLTPREIFHRTEHLLKNVEFRHMNIWDFPYDFKADTVQVEQMLIKGKSDGYVRCLRASFENLTVRSPETPIPQMQEWKPVGNRFWGYPQMMVLEDDRIYSRLFMEQQTYADLAEALRDMEDSEKLDYSVICEEIVGDG